MRLRLKKYIRFIFVFIFTVISFISCSKNRVSELERVNLFSLNYGNFDDELNLFDLSNIGEINTKLIMSDGFFYISNSEAKKIIKLNSYGDLLSIFYNNETNPHPFIADKNENGKNATRTATYYPFNEISYLAVDSLKNLFVVEKLPSERCEFDSKLNISLSQVVLRFDTNGNFIDYIGQEGPGGMPFPFIKNIFVMKNGELVVVTSVGQSYTVYYYKTSGYLQKKAIELL